MNCRRPPSTTTTIPSLITTTTTTTTTTPEVNSSIRRCYLGYLGFLGFLGNTKITCDQGDISIASLYENDFFRYFTINGTPISGITKTFQKENTLICIKKNIFYNNSEDLFLSKHHKVIIHNRKVKASKLLSKYSDDFVCSVVYDNVQQPLFHILMEEEEEEEEEEEKKKEEKKEGIILANGIPSVVGGRKVQ